MLLAKQRRGDCRMNDRPDASRLVADDWPGIPDGAPKACAALKSPAEVDGVEDLRAPGERFARVVAIVSCVHACYP